MTDFVVCEETWIAKLGNLRNTIRQELISRQINKHLDERRSVLDVGCGQGTQAIRLMQAGRSVVGVEPSSALLERFRYDASQLGFTPDLRQGGVDDLDRLIDHEVFDVVCAHGLLMYLDDPAAAIGTLARRVAPGGLLSITFKNGHGLALRPALRSDWAAALASFDEPEYLNELGVHARSHRLDDAKTWLGATDLEMDTWYGVRVFNDGIAGDVSPPTDGSLSQLLDAEERAGNTDPYRWLGSQIHVIATRSPS